MSAQPASVEVRVAAVLVGTGTVFGVLLMVLGASVLEGDPGFLFAILPIVFLVLVTAGLFLACASLVLALGLWRCRPGSRLHAAIVGGCLVGSALFFLTVSPVAAVVLLLYGGLLLWLMTTPGAARDLGPWLRQLQRPAPWGSTPGTGLWSPEPPQQGPWSPAPTTIPWTSWKNHSGPRPPWWQTWEAGLSQGIPLWEALVLGAALLVFVPSLACVLVPDWRGFAVVGIPVSIGAVALMEQRMRRRLERRG